MKKLQRIRQFTSNASLACYHIIRGSTSWRAATARIWVILIDLMLALWRPKVSKEMARARYRVCFKCVLFDKKRRTCGIISSESWYRDPVDGNLKTVGCFCDMAAKCRWQVNCWATGRRLKIMGWPTELNSFTEVDK